MRTNRIKKNYFRSLIVVVLAVAMTWATVQVSEAASGQMRWPHKQGAYPYIVIENHASDFPVLEAVNVWGKPLHYGYCDRYPSNPCVKVYEKRWGNDGTAGLTPLGGYDTTMTYARVYLNRYYGRTQGHAFRLETVLHELGHAMGLVHDNGSGVMRPAVDGKHTSPSAYERRELRQLYIG